MISKAAFDAIETLRADRSAIARAPLTLGERRERFEARAKLLPIPADLAISSATIAGVACDGLTPPGAKEMATLLYIHGGGYCLGSPRSHRELAGRIARAAGMKAILPDYRLAPMHPFPAALDDALSVYASILEETGAPPAAICGDSAGGGLALALLVAARDERFPLPRAAAAISPWTDLTLSGASMAERAELDPYLSPGNLEQAAAAYSGGRYRGHPLICNCSRPCV
jgi:acetyl esterase/lipase